MRNKPSELNTDVQNLPGKTTSVHQELVNHITDGIMVIFQDSRGRHWFGGGAEGVYRYDGEQLFFLTAEDGPCGKRVLGIQEDRYGRIFFDGTEGVCAYDETSFTLLPVTEPDDPTGAWELQPDDLWFRMGWSNNGPYRYDGKNLYRLEFPAVEQADSFYTTYPNASFSPYGIYSQYRDREGSIWFGTAALGVCRYDGESIDWLYEEDMTTIPGGGALGIRSVLQDQRGDFWFTTTRYRYVIEPGRTIVNETSYLNYHRMDGVGHRLGNGKIEYPYYMDSTEDNDDKLWFASCDEGVCCYDGERFLHYPVKNENKDVSLFSIYTDREGTIWGSSYDLGVFRWEKEAFVWFMGK